MIRTLAHWLLDPLHHLLLALLLGAIFIWRGKQIGRYLLYYAAFWFFLTLISPLPVWLTQKREARYPIFSRELLSAADTSGVHIVVLGGGHSYTPTFPPNDQLSRNALGRLVEGVRLYRLVPGSQLVCSGYSSTGRISQAEVLANTALVLGVPPADTLLMPTPFNTEAEARAYVSRFGTGHPLILVTSAIHMHRAMFWFRQMGLEPLPAPTDHIIKPDPDYSGFPFKPSIRKMEMTQRLLHEWAGMVYGGWTGRRPLR